MNVLLEPNKYVVAVSGGVDSVVLLHILMQQNQYPVTSNQNSVKETENGSQKTDTGNSLELVVAHFDHGIRSDSAIDCQFVKKLAKKYGLEFTYKTEKLGKSASEELARSRRYRFLATAVKKHHAEAIITAHHKDDLLETAVFNLLRGTGRSGLTSLKSTDEIIRPLLNYKKTQIIRYAKDNKLVWREDSTNKTLKYSRNKVRNFLGGVTSLEKDKINNLISDASSRNLEIDALVEGLFVHGYNKQNKRFDRIFFISLPHKIACEVLVFWLKKLEVQYDKKLIEKLANDLKVLLPGSRVDISKNYFFIIDKKQISIERR